MKQPFAPVVWLSERPPTPTVEAAFTAIGRPLLREAGPPDPPANADALRLTATWSAERAQTPSAGHPIVFIREEGAPPSPTRTEALPTPGALLRALSLAYTQAETDLLYGILDRQARAFSANRIAAWRFDFEPPGVESVHLIDGFDTRIETATGDERILERLTFRHVSAKAVLVAEAWRGSNLKDCYVACEKAMLSGENQLVAFIGHNVLMDTAIEAPAAKAKGQTDAIVLCCVSDRYFRQRLGNAGVRPVLLTTQLMYPGAFILHDALEPWLAGKNPAALRTAAGAAYAKNQKIKTAAATGVFSVIAP
jgi:hypothetical protein